MESPDEWSVSPTKLSQWPIVNKMRWQCLEETPLANGSSKRGGPEDERMKMIPSSDAAVGLGGSGDWGHFSVPGVPFRPLTSASHSELHQVSTPDLASHHGQSVVKSPEKPGV
jgi:hypothetical protein